MKHLIQKIFDRRLCLGIFLSVSSSLSSAAAAPMIVGMGDSIGEGVQAEDAAWQTQVFGYLNWLSFQMGGDLTIPYIQTNALGSTQDTQNRSRILPNDINTNVAVSGANVSDLLNDAADATTVEEMDDEVDLVMFPRMMTQMEYVESVLPELVACWIGANDALAAATSFDQLDASQLTPLDEFALAYVELADRLGALMTSHDTKVVLANIPDVTDIGFVIDRLAAEAITGFPVALPDGHFTTVITAVLMREQGNDALMANPNFVLDDVELDVIENRIAGFNVIIQAEADRIGAPVVDIQSTFAEIISVPPIYFGRPLTKSVLGGLFSNDGVHPSNLGQALVANEFIETINAAYGMTIPEISQATLNYIYLTDPSTDKDNDGKAKGRFGVGLLESLFFLLGFTGDPNDFVPN